MAVPSTGSYHSGLSGLVLPIPKYRFPPGFEDASRLQYYASIMNSIEINSSFYKVPQATTVGKWADAVGPDFTFTFKLWKQITHCNGLHFEKADVEIFYRSIAAVGEKKGCLLIQFPPKLGIDSFSQFKVLLESIKEIDPTGMWPLAVEFRHRSWYDDSVYHLLDQYTATLVIQDIPKSATPMIDLESYTIYLRFHGPTGNYGESYSTEVLEEHAEYVLDWMSEGKKVFTYFNNTSGNAFENLQTFNAFIKQRLTVD
ncbi:MAG: DUF72 domain-containing protein [Bacteroidota bacterium]|nr:DUF72 domain-containing protein [Bacteroidota bacterium]